MHRGNHTRRDLAHGDYSSQSASISPIKVLHGISHEFLVVAASVQIQNNAIGGARGFEGWRMLPKPPVRFIRPAGMRPLPEPTEDGSLAALRPFVNVATEDDFRLLVGFLVSAFMPNGPYFILVLNGEQGSGKSTLSRIVRELVDPNEAPIRALSGDGRDLMIAARNGHLLCFDNLSGLSPAQADALCRLASGVGFGTRALYSDGEEMLFSGARPILLNGIPDLVTRGDLADRSLIVTLPEINGRQRRTEADFRDAFGEARPGILGALLDAVSCALRCSGTVELDSLPRMADCARWITAAEPALDWAPGSFLAAYRRNREKARDVLIEADLVAAALWTFMASTRQWSGTATELVGVLSPPNGYRAGSGWPNTAAKMGERLRRIAPVLREEGILISFPRSGERRGISIQRTEAQDNAGE